MNVAELLLRITGESSGLVAAVERSSASLDTLDENVGVVVESLDGLNHKFDQVVTSLGEVVGALTGLDEKLGSVTDSLIAIEGKFDDVSASMDRMSADIAANSALMSAGFDRIGTAAEAMAAKVVASNAIAGAAAGGSSPAAAQASVAPALAAAAAARAGGGGSGGPVGSALMASSASKMLGFGTGIAGLGGFGTLAGFAGFGAEHVALTGLGVAGSAVGGALGGGLLGLGAMGTMAAGGGADMAVMKSTIADTQALAQNYAALTAAVQQYGAGSTQAVAASATLDQTMISLGNTAGVQAELGLAKAAAALNAFWDKETSAARVAAVSILMQVVNLGTTYVPIVAEAAHQNLMIINTSLEPLFAWLEGPTGIGIFDNLENIFRRNLPSAMDAFVQGIELLLKTVNVAAGYTGNFIQKLDQLLIRLNSPPDFNRWSVEIGKLIAQFRDWEAFGIALGKTLYLVFSQTLGLGTSIITTLTGMLDKLDVWLASTQGKAQLHSLFSIHLQEIMQLLQFIPILVGALGPLYLTVAPAITQVTVALLGLVLQIIAFLEKGQEMTAIGGWVSQFGALGKSVGAAMDKFKSASGEIFIWGLGAAIIAGKTGILTSSFGLLGGAVQTVTGVIKALVFMQSEQVAATDAQSVANKAGAASAILFRIAAALVGGAVFLWTLATEGLTAAQVMLNAAMWANPVGVVIAAIVIVIAIIAALVVGIVLLVTHWKQVTTTLHNFWLEIVKVADTISKWIEQHKALAASILILTNILFPPIGLILDLIAVISLLITHWQWVEQELHNFWDLIQKVAADISKFIDQHQILAGVIMALGGPVTVMIGLISELITHWKDVTQAVQDAWQKLQDFGGYLNGYKTPTAATEDLKTTASITNAGVTNAEDAHKTAVAKYGANSPQAKAAAASVAAAQVQNQKAQSQVAASMTQHQGIIQQLTGYQTPASVRATQELPAANQAVQQAEATQKVVDTHDGATSLQAKKASGVVIKAKESRDKLKKESTGVKGGLEDAADWAMSGVSIGDTLAKIGGFFSKLGATAQQVEQAIGQFFSNVGTTANNGVNAIGAFFNAVGTDAHQVITTIGGFFNQVGTDVHNMVVTVGRFVGMLLQPFKDAFNEIISVTRPFVLVFTAIFMSLFHFVIGLFLWFNQVVGILLGDLGRAIGNLIGPPLNWLRNTFMTVLHDIWTFMVDQFNRWRQSWVDTFKVITTLATNFWDLVKGLFTTVFTWIKNLIDDQFNKWKQVWTQVFNAIRTLVTGWVKDVQTFFSDHFGWVWTLITGQFDRWRSEFGKVFNDIRTLVSTWVGDVENFFSNLQTGLASAMQQIADNVSGKIQDGFNGALQHVIDFIKQINSVLTGLGLPPITPPSLIDAVNTTPASAGSGGATHKGAFAGGGTVPGYAPGQDTVHALLSPGEGILTPQATRGLGGAGAIAAINSAFGPAAFAAGGVVGSGLTGLAAAIGTIGGQCLEWVHAMTGFGGGIPAADDLAPLVNSHIAAPGEIFVSTMGQYGHTGFVIGPNQVEDSNWVSSLTVGVHKLSDIPSIVGFITGHAPAGMPGGGGGILSMLLSAPEKVLTDAVGGIPGWPGKIAQGAIKMALDGLNALSPSGGSSSAGTSGGTPADVLGWLHAGEAAAGVGTDWDAGLGIIAKNESGDNPNASQGGLSGPGQAFGLMQMVRGTFEAHRLSSLPDDIFNAVANVASAIKYIQAEYGGIQGVPGVQSVQAGQPYKPYADGGVAIHPQFASLAENGPEMVLPFNPANASGGNADQTALLQQVVALLQQIAQPQVSPVNSLSAHLRHAH